MGAKVKELQKLNNQLDKKINAENQAIFTDMICYIRSADISDYNQEVVRHDLSEMLLSAQERGEDIHTVIGGDFKEFCDEVVVNLPTKTIKEKIFEWLDIFCSCMAILGTINVLFSRDLRRVIEEIFAKQVTNYSIGISLGMIISMAVILIGAIFIVNIISKNAFKMLSGSNKLNRMLIGGVAGAGIMALFIIIAKFGSRVIFSANIFLVLLILAAFFITHKLLNRI